MYMHHPTDHQYFSCTYATLKYVCVQSKFGRNKKSY
jgi:hypothetical protein